MNRNDEMLVERLQSVAQQIELSPEFHQRFENELRLHHEQRQGRLRSRTTIYLRRLTTIAAAFVMLLAVILLVPPFRSLAQDIIDSLFTRAESNERVQTFPTISDRELLQAEDYHATLLTVEEAEALADFDLKVPDAVPSVYVFRGVSYTSKDRTTKLIYSLAGMGLEISQQPLEYADLRKSTWPVGADAEIVKVELDTLTGEYVEGAWIVTGGEWVDRGGDIYQIDRDEDIYDDKSTGVTTEKSTWLANAPIRRLRWAEDDFLYEILSMGGSEGHGKLGLQELIDIALSMQ